MLISDIKPYERNARRDAKAIPKVAESIRKFGLRGSIVLESRDNPVIVCGHTRVAAAKSLGWTEIPDDHIEYCDGLTQDEIDAFRLIDNKTGEIATWNVALLKSEAKRLNGKLDFARYGFDFKSKVKPYGAERARTDDYYNLRLCDIDDCAGCALKAVNLGADTDTTAAVAGGLAGIVYGIDSIPAEWIAKLRGKDVIDACLFA